MGLPKMAIKACLVFFVIEAIVQDNTGTIRMSKALANALSAECSLEM